jgi:hypothetical protein
MADFTAELDRLRRRGLVVEAGLTDHERKVVEGRYGFRFPPDLAEFLATGLPLGDDFPDWRRPTAAIQEQLDWPLEGILFDIEHSSFWLPEWGARPAELERAKAIATERVGGAPRLIPISGHRYLVSEPCEAGNPVLSVHQTDIIWYGSDLASYFEAEYGAGYSSIDFEAIRSVRFWSRMVEANGG